MKLALVLFLFVSIIYSCKSENKSSERALKIEEKDNTYSKGSALDSVKYDNGIKVHWLKKGKGQKVQLFDLVEIEYKVFLENGELIEGSHMFNGTFPFLVGFQMQTLGWDFVLQQLRIGDEIEAFIPSALARGEKGIEGLIPPNSNNILYLKIVEKRKPSKEIDGVKVYAIAQNRKNKTLFNKENSIVFHTMVSTPSNQMYFNSFRENKPFTLKMRDAGVVPGLKKALNNAKKADRLYIVIPPSEAYGTNGMQDIVKPNEYLFYNLYVVDVF